MVRHALWGNKEDIKVGIITSILKRPSQRTMLEATIAGLSVLLITSIITPIYILFFSQSALWLKMLSGIGGVGLFLLMFSNLSMTYIQYYSFKMAMGLYTPSDKLLMKLEDAKQVKKELEELIKENELEYSNKLNKDGGNKC